MGGVGRSPTGGIEMAKHTAELEGLDIPGLLDKLAEAKAEAFNPAASV